MGKNFYISNDKNLHEIKKKFDDEANKPET